MANNKRLNIFLLIFLAIVATIIFFKSSPTHPIIGQNNTLRQILQAQETTTELITELPYDIEQRLNYTGNLPDIYLEEKPKTPKLFNKTCAKYPDLFTLKFQNDYWQMQNTENGTFYLFNAYVDDRPNASVVRIVGMYDVYRPEREFYCQFWYQNSYSPKVVRSEKPLWLFRKGWGADKGHWIHPYIFTCPLVSYKNVTPMSVSLVDKPCQNPTNNLKLFYGEKNHSKKDFVVCVKGLSFPYQDQTARLVEWIELINILGADKINFYEFSIHPNTQKLLNYYARQGLVELTPISVVGDVSNTPYFQNTYLRKKILQRRLQEVIPFNDCLYKHLQEFKYVVLLDTDEVIIPIQGTWPQLINKLQKTLPYVNSFMARNVYFLDTHLHQHDWIEGIPKYMHMLQHIYRAKNYTKPGNFVKGFHNTTSVLALHNHFPFYCLRNCKNKEMDVKLAHLQHYRANCAAGVSNCQIMKENSVVDSRIWNYKSELIGRVEEVLEKLGLTYSDSF